MARGEGPHDDDGLRPPVFMELGCLVSVFLSFRLICSTRMFPDTPLLIVAGMIPINYIQ